MATDLDIRMKVDSSQIDQAAQKVGELKQLSSTISIQYDIDGKPLDVVIDKSANLRKQVVDLTKALRSVKEGSAEFRILSSALGDAQDKLAASNAKSRDLLGSLQLIPGPIGQIASQLNGAISALKLFSGFSMKDLKFQFKELNNDLNDIVKNLFGVGGAANKAKAELADTGATALNTAAEVKNTEVTTKNAEAQLGSAGAKDKDVVATDADTDATIRNTKAKRFNTYEDIAEQEAKEAKLAVTYQELQAEGLLLNQRTEELKQGALNNTLTQEEIATKTQLLKTDALAYQTKVKQFEIDQQAVILREKQILEIEAETLARESGTGAVVKDTAAKNANNAATGGLINSIKAFATSTLGIIAIIGAATYALYKYIDGRVKLNEAEKEGLEVEKKAVDIGQENISLLNNLILTVKRSDVTQREKNKAVNDYNEKLGDTLGKVKSYDELTNKLVLNGPAYIDYLRVKSKAEAAYALSVETTKKALQKGAEDPVENLSIFAKLIGFEMGLADTTMKRIGGNVRDANAKEIQKTADDYFGLFQGFQKEAVDAANKLKLPIPEIKTDGAKPQAQKPKELQDDALLQKEKELSAALIKEKKDREIYELEIAKNREAKEIKDLNISQKNKGVQAAALLALENKFQIEKQAIITKYDDEQKKKDEELAKQKKDAANELRDLGINSIKDEVVKSRVERLKQFNDEKEKLDQYLKDGLITREKYNEAILNMQKAFANDIEKINTDARVKELEATKAIDESRLRLFQMNMDQSNAARLWFIDDFIAQQLKVEEDNFLIEKERHKNNANELLRIDQEHANNVASIKEAERQQKLQIYNKGLDDLIGIFAAESDLQKSAIILKQTLLGIELAMEIKKAIASAKLTVAKSKVDLASGVAATAKVGFPQNIIPIALYAIQAAAIISTIVTAVKGMGKGDVKAEAPPMGANYGAGGIIEGPSHRSAAGGVPIMAEGGEAVMTRGAVAAFRPLLSAMNQMGGGTAFSGGVTGQAPFDNPATAEKTMEPQIIKTYIVERDLTSSQERQARLKSLSTL